MISPRSTPGRAGADEVLRGDLLHAGLKVSTAVPVGGVALGAELEPVIDRASELLGYAPVSEWLRECYLPHNSYKPTLGGAFGRLMAKIFADQGLIVMDASTRGFHALGASTLQYAIEHAPELQTALIARSEELVREGYHAQVLVAEGGSMLFLLDETTGERVALRRSAEGQWKAGSRAYSSAELLAILAAEPERLSPNALLRPVFQDTLLPTTAYVGGPAEIAYFAQSSVLYDHILGRVTPILPPSQRHTARAVCSLHHGQGRGSPARRPHNSRRTGPEARRKSYAHRSQAKTGRRR